MARVPAQRFAQGSILVLLLALARTLAEYYRLRASLGAEAGLHALAPYVGGILVGLIGLGAALLLYFGGRIRTVVGRVVFTLVVLIAYKVRGFGV